MHGTYLEVLVDSTDAVEVGDDIVGSHDFATTGLSEC